MIFTDGTQQVSDCTIVCIFMQNLTVAYFATRSRSHSALQRWSELWRFHSQHSNAIAFVSVCVETILHTFNCFSMLVAHSCTQTDLSLQLVGSPASCLDSQHKFQQATGFKLVDFINGVCCLRGHAVWLVANHAKSGAHNAQANQPCQHNYEHELHRHCSMAAEFDLSLV